MIFSTYVLDPIETGQKTPEVMAAFAASYLSPPARRAAAEYMKAYSKQGDAALVRMWMKSNAAVFPAQNSALSFTKTMIDALLNPKIPSMPARLRPAED